MIQSQLKNDSKGPISFPFLWSPREGLVHLRCEDESDIIVACDIEKLVGKRIEIGTGQPTLYAWAHRLPASSVVTMRNSG